MIIKEVESTINEIMRRKQVIDEKLAGAIIKMIERMRTQPVVQSISLRLYYFNKNLLEIINNIGIYKAGELKQKSPSLLTKHINHLIATYNSIINDVEKNLKKKDAYVSSLNKFEELKDPINEEIVNIFFILGINIQQILSYLIRWTETK